MAATGQGWAYDRATALTPRGPGAWTAEVAAGWDMGGHANGGYLAALALGALGRTVGAGSAVLVEATYLRSAAPGALDVATEVQHRGGRHQVAEAVLRQGQGDVARVRAIFSTARTGRPAEYLRSAPPPLPPPEQCVHPRPDLDLPFRPPPITGKVELRIHPEHAGFAVGAPHGTAEIAGWARFADGRPPDHGALPLFVDAFPPAVFNAGLALSWVPTLQLSVHLLREPAGGWLRLRLGTRSVTDGYLEEDAEVWDSEGHLVARSRQLALAPRPAA